MNAPTSLLILSLTLKYCAPPPTATAELSQPPKTAYFSSRILSSLSNPRTLWENINHILHRNTNRTLPTSSPLSSLPHLFVTYFYDKITKLYFNLQSNFPPLRFTYSAFIPPILSSFTPATLLEITNFVFQSSNSSCDLDPIIEQVNIRCNISNHSIHCKSLPSHSTFPPPLKSSLVSPLLKKSSLNKDDPSNYRPIANISFISKLMEKIVKNRLFAHLSSTSLLNTFQSAYTKNYCTETTLFCIHDHLSNAISHQHVSCLCLLDLSAAFDILDHSILLHRLSSYFGLSSLFSGSLHTYRLAHVPSPSHRTSLPHPLLHVVSFKAPFLALFCSIYT